MTLSRDNVIGLDASIIMHPDVWRASGHVAGFADPLVDCKLSKERFRADKAPAIDINDKNELLLNAPDKGIAQVWLDAIKSQHAPGVKAERRGKTVVLFVKSITQPENGAGGAIVFEGENGGADVTLEYRGYVTPEFNSPFLSPERTFNLMFRTFLGSVDPLTEIVDAFLANKDKSPNEIDRKSVV